MSNAAEESVEEPQVSKNKQHRKPKPWDVEGTDHVSYLPSCGLKEADLMLKWKIEPFLATDSSGVFLAESEFITLFPKYREKYIREIWSALSSALDGLGIKSELDLIEGQISVKTTRKTIDPYILLKARDVVKLICRSVPLSQAVKVLQDEISSDIIKIGSLVRNKERLVKRRQRLIGPSGSTLKAIELLTESYIFVQGNTVAVVGGFKALKDIRRLVEDCMHNIHPIYGIKEMMIKKKLAADPELANQSWDRFLPKFKKRNLKTSEKTASKNAKIAALAEKRGVDVQEIIKEKKSKKKEYTPFPPAMPLSTVDKQLETGEYFLKASEKAKAALDARKQERKRKQKEREERRQADFEASTSTVQEEPAVLVKKRKNDDSEAAVDGESKKSKKSRKEKEDKKDKKEEKKKKKKNERTEKVEKKDKEDRKAKKPKDKD